MGDDELNDDASRSHDGYVVGLGASAGGLEALKAFFAAMPADSGMSFVVVTHQPADRRSLLPELLARVTEMPVVLVEQPTPMLPNHVYAAPSAHDLHVHDGVLEPVAVFQGYPHMPIDAFFRSLASDLEDRSVAVVLSGTGSDGSLGIREIKNELGLVMVQDEASAEHAGMPHSALATGLVDITASAELLPARLMDYVEASRSGESSSKDRELEALPRLFALIRDEVGHDFSQYKMATVGRRIERRMQVRRHDSLPAYVDYLSEHPDEVRLLFKELLIAVTSFFRDPDAWRELEGALRRLLAEMPDVDPIRVWIPGCATGEEAYSVAIVLRELLAESDTDRAVQIFATDLDPAVIDVARTGLYPLGIAADVSAARLERFFIREGDGYRVKPMLREMLVLAPHNVIGNPPFTKLQLLVCRNLLIYLDASVQRRLLPVFHYALVPGGLLFLGPSESVGGSDLFGAVSAEWNVFRRLDTSSRTNVPDLPSASSAGRRPLGDVSTTRFGVSTMRFGEEPRSNLSRLAERTLARRLLPPTVLVRERGDLVYVHGHTGRFLELAPGTQIGANIFNMARPGLQVGLSSVIRRAVSTEDEAVFRGLRVRSNGDEISVDLEARRLSAPDELRGLVMISFVNPVVSDAKSASPSSSSGSARQALELEGELRYAKESHQATIEELQASNEELVSTNEELQSANEELETSKEEMQSLNEELQAVNAELQEKVAELSKASNDMRNLLNGTNIATVFLDGELKIRGFTEQAKQVIRLIPSDVGRPIADLAPALRYDRLVPDLREVVRTLVLTEREVVAEDGTCFLMRVLPYRTTENSIEGLVLSFVDLTETKRVQHEQERLLRALTSAGVSVYGQDRELGVTWGSGDVFAGHSPDLVGKTEQELFAPADAAQLQTLKRDVIASRQSRQLRLSLQLTGKTIPYDVYVEPQLDGDGNVDMLSTVMIARPA